MRASFSPSAAEGTLLTFGVTATDYDLPANTLTYSATGLPPGAAFDPTTRVFSWTPGELQGGQTFSGIRFAVNDGLGGSASETISITVIETNSPPVPTPIANQTVVLTHELRVTASATDPDDPVQSLTFGLTPGAPADATINAVSGVLVWTPAAPLSPGHYPITVRVTDAGVPARFVSGHFLRSDGTTQQQAGHAWTEAYVPDLGWVGFDTANGICTTDAHARVAIGLDYLGAAPVRGTRYGGGAETLTVAVKVEQAGRPGQWQSQSQS